MTKFTRWAKTATWSPVVALPWAMRKVRGNAPMLAVFLLGGCTPVPDRHAGPHAALTAARFALHNHDLAGYYDALTDKGVRETLDNSIAICGLSDPAVRAQMGLAAPNPSIGCDSILTKFGWTAIKGATSEASYRARQEALRLVARPRDMAVALEENHRRTGAGTSFVWEWLDHVTLKNIVIFGDKATAVASWSGEDRPMKFERDASGWRFAPVIKTSGAQR